MSQLSRLEVADFGLVSLVVFALAVLLWFWFFFGSAVCCSGLRPRSLQPRQGGLRQ
jgi:hypothetical protein